MPKHRSRSKSHSTKKLLTKKTGLLVSLLLIMSAAIIVVQNPWYVRNPYQLAFLPIGPLPSCYPLCPATSTTTATIPTASTRYTTSTYAGFTSSSLTPSMPVTPNTIGVTWQEWTIHYVDGKWDSYSNQYSGVPINFDVTKNDQPSWIDIRFGAQLTRDLVAGQLMCQPIGQGLQPCKPLPGGSWIEQLVAIGSMEVGVDGIGQIGGGNNLQNPMMFTYGQAQNGDTKYWTARIIFSGSPPASTPSVCSTCVADLSHFDILQGKARAHVTVINQQLWTKNIINSISFGQTGVVICDGTQIYVPALLPGQPPWTDTCKVTQTYFYPGGGVWFDWSVGAFATDGTITQPPPNVITCPSELGGSATICVSNPSYSATQCFGSVIGDVCVTVVESPTLTPIGPAGNPNIGPPGSNSTSPGQPQGPSSCQLNLITGLWSIQLPAWMCMKTLGTNNIVLILLLIAGFIVFIIVLSVLAKLAGLFRRNKGGQQGGQGTVYNTVYKLG